MAIWLKRGATTAERRAADRKVRDIVEAALADIEDRGDDAVRDMSIKFDNWDREDYRLTQAEIDACVDSLTPQERKDIEFAQTQVRNFAQIQREGCLVKIMPVNRIATRQDQNEVINGLDLRAFERRQAEAPNKPVERIHLVCMRHEPDLGPALQKEAKPFDIEVMVTDLIRDEARLHFKKASDARLAIENGELVIKGFYPMNLLQKLSLESDAVEDWRQLVESVKVDFHYDGAVLTPAIVDAPGKEELIAGRYAIPADAATIRVKITDLLSESWEGDIENG